MKRIANAEKELRDRSSSSFDRRECVRVSVRSIRFYVDDVIYYRLRYLNAIVPWHLKVVSDDFSDRWIAAGLHATNRFIIAARGKSRRA